VSRRHLVIQPAGQGWQLVDQSSNGSFVEGRRIGRLGVTSPVTVSLGAPANAPFGVIGIAASTDLMPASSIPAHGPDAPEVAARSAAQGRPSAVHNLLMDLDSPNSSYVNGQRVTGAPIGSQDVVGIGHALLQVNGDRLVARTSAGRQLLDRVGFSLEQCSLLAEVGPSGAGNSSQLGLLRCAKPGPGEIVDPGWSDRQGQLVEGS
jgi:ABC transport system ATP-binding/permease protein